MAMQRVSTRPPITQAMAASPGRVHSRQSLLEQVWGDVEAGPRTVDVHVAQLRAKGIPLRTVRGSGYAAVRG